MKSRTLLALLTAPALMAAPAFAETADVGETADVKAVDVESVDAVEPVYDTEYMEYGADAFVVEPYGLTVERVEDMGVFNADGTQIGEIDDILTTPDGKIGGFSIETESFLGIGGEDVVVELDKVRLEGDHFVTDLTEEQLESRPRWRD